MSWGIFLQYKWLMFVEVAEYGQIGIVLFILDIVGVGITCGSIFVDIITYLSMW